LRKVLAGCLCASVAAAPAVAFAATDEDNETNVSVVPQAAKSLTVKRDTRFKRNHAVHDAAREHRKVQKRKRARRLAKQEQQAAPTAAGGSTATPAHLEAIAACESGGNPAAVGGGGAYRGKYQFDYGTWASVGGSGDPAAASEAEQDQRAAMLYAQAGSTPWPNCG
jgi:hypothetical protein